MLGPERSAQARNSRSCPGPGGPAAAAPGRSPTASSGPPASAAPGAPGTGTSSQASRGDLCEQGTQGGRGVPPAVAARAAARFRRVGGGSWPRRRLAVGGLLLRGRRGDRRRRARLDRFGADRPGPDAGPAPQPGAGGDGGRHAGPHVSRPLRPGRWARRPGLDGPGGSRVRSPMTLLREWVTAVRSLLNGETVTVSGQYVRLDDVALDWPPQAVPPLLVGARGPRTVALAGEIADGLVLDAGITPDGVRRAVATTAAARPHEVVVYLLCAAGPDARERPEAELAAAPQQPANPSQTVLAECTAVGSAAAVARTIGAYARAGATTVVLQPTADDPDAAETIRLAGPARAARRQRKVPLDSGPGDAELGGDLVPRCSGAYRPGRSRHTSAARSGPGVG